MSTYWIQIIISIVSPLFSISMLVLLHMEKATPMQATIAIALALNLQLISVALSNDPE